MSELPQPTSSPDPYRFGSELESDDSLENTLKTTTKTTTNSINKTSTQSQGKRLRDFNDLENLEISLPTDKEFFHFGRILGRQDDPFTIVEAVVDFGIRSGHANGVEGEIGRDQSTLSPQNYRLLHSWELLRSLIPDFCQTMLALSSDYRYPSRKAASGHIHHGITTVRSDDTASLKVWILSYILINPTDSISPSIALKSKRKDDRGFHHPATAYLLCPMMTYDDISSGRLPITATLLPRFLFPDGHIYDPNDISKDLLRGHVMYRAAKHIFQGPSAALESPGSHRGKQGNASICGITEMSPRTIAYVATQVRFALSSTSSWTARDGSFSYADFYWCIVGLLDDEDEVEGPEIIQFYNYHIFGTKDPQHVANTAPEVVDEYELVKQQRAAKRARISRNDS